MSCTPFSVFSGCVLSALVIIKPWQCFHLISHMLPPCHLMMVRIGGEKYMSRANNMASIDFDVGMPVVLFSSWGRRVVVQAARVCFVCLIDLGNAQRQHWLRSSPSYLSKNLTLECKGLLTVVVQRVK